MGKKKRYFLQKFITKLHLTRLIRQSYKKTLGNIIDSPFVTFYRAQPQVLAIFGEDGQMLADDRANTERHSSSDSEKEEEDEDRYDDVHMDDFFTLELLFEMAEERDKGLNEEGNREVVMLVGGVAVLGVDAVAVLPYPRLGIYRGHRLDDRDVPDELVGIVRVVTLHFKWF